MAGAIRYVDMSGLELEKKALELMLCSPYCWRNWRLLLRQANPQQPRHSFDQAFVANRGA